MSDEPWGTQQPNEGPEAFEAFTTYRDAGGDRSVRRVAQALDKSVTLIGEWSSRHNWVRRVAAYERHLDEQRRASRENARADMEGRQATQLAAAAQALTQPIRAFLERIQKEREAGVDPFAKMSIVELGRLTSSSIRHLGSVIESERLVAGLSTENVAPDVPATVEEARRRADGMNRGQLETYLVGVDDGKATMLKDLGLAADGEVSAGEDAGEGRP